MKWYTLVRNRIAYEVYADNATEAHNFFLRWLSKPVETERLRRKKVTQRRPPKRHCRECGADVYSYPENPLCQICQERENELPHLNIRETLRLRREAEQSSRSTPGNGAAT